MDIDSDGVLLTDAWPVPDQTLTGLQYSGAYERAERWLRIPGPSVPTRHEPRSLLIQVQDTA
ncbi:hypothetical protein D0Q02_29085 [Micromonospora craniellae]|uniref:Uncharacterized protein n=1 Tax=Micromonospora craniellae TaxID=2294034 RepID=A0A372FR09_9ACTN|nr:hypothetical protein D0Q02_29085 [Micromonospora craniellae]